MAEKKIKVRNVSNGLVTEFSEAGWAKAQKDPRWANVFREVTEPETPEEVKRLQDRKTTTQDVKATANTGKDAKKQ